MPVNHFIRRIYGFPGFLKPSCLILSYRYGAPQK